MSHSFSEEKNTICVVSIYPKRGTVHPEEGGVASYTHNLCNALVQNGERVSVICNIEGGGSAEQYDENDVHVERIFKKDHGFFWNIAKAVRELNPSTVHFQQELSLYGGILSAYLLPLGIKMSGSSHKVVTLHAVVAQAQIDDSFIKDNNSKTPVAVVKIAFRVLYSLLDWAADDLIVHEVPFKERLIEDYNIRPEKISIIPHGIELAERSN